jgi:hypothetical protein
LVCGLSTVQMLAWLEDLITGFVPLTGAKADKIATKPIMLNKRIFFIV